MQAPARRRGVADIVFLLDLTGSMTPCIDALKANIGVFIDGLDQGVGNQASPLKEWRAKIVGFRDWEFCTEPFVDNPFTRDADELKVQLAPLQLEHSVDEPESLLDALFKLANMGATEKGVQNEDPARWRYRSDAARVVIAFTDAPYKEPMQLPEAAGGGVQDVSNALVQNRIILSLFAPDLPCYDLLSQVDRCEWEVVSYPGLDAQESLARFTSDPDNFRNTLRQLAASVSKSATTVQL